MAKEVKSEWVLIKGVEPFVFLAERHGFDPKLVVKDLSFTLEEVYKGKRRIPWSEFSTCAQRAQEMAGSAEEFTRWGADFMDSPAMKLLTQIGSAVLSVSKLYWVGSKVGGNQMFPLIKSEFKRMSATRLVMTLEPPSGEDVSEAFYNFTAGSQACIPRLIGQPDSSVKMSREGRKAIYEVDHVPSRTIFAILKHAVMLPFGIMRVFKHLKEQNEELAHRLSELTEAHRKTEKARQVAEEASRLKSDFLRNLSHELRTPMNGVLGMAEVLSYTELDEEQNELLADLNTSGIRMQRCIERLLDFTQVEAGRLHLSPTPFVPDELTQSVVNDFIATADEKLIDLHFEHIATTSAVVRADHLRVREIVEVLVENAVKFTESGSIDVRVRGDGPGWLHFEVEDTGPGIAPEDQKALFEPFRQADASVTRAHEGLGLGLAVAHRLTTEMGGEIGVQSTLGQGSKFWFRIPFEEPESVENTAPARPVARSPILIVEDNPLNRRVLQEQLAICGYEADLVENGQEALQAVQNRDYQLVLMDCQMPVLDGYEATRRIRAMRDTLGDIPVVAVTAHNMPGDEEACYEAGMDGFLAKPVRRLALAEVIGRYLTPPNAEGLENTEPANLDAPEAPLEVENPPNLEDSPEDPTARP